MNLILIVLKKKLTNVLKYFFNKILNINFKIIF